MKKFFFLFVILFLLHSDVFAQENWYIQDVPTSREIYSVTFTDSTIGWAVGEGGTILKTTNGGEDWKLQPDSINYALRCVCFINENIGWIVGYGAIMKTTNSGNTWVTKTNLPFAGGVDVGFKQCQFIDLNA